MWSMFRFSPARFGGRYWFMASLEFACRNLAGASHLLHGRGRVEPEQPSWPRSCREARTAALTAKKTLIASTSGGSPTSFDESRSNGFSGTSGTSRGNRSMLNTSGIVVVAGTL